METNKIITEVKDEKATRGVDPLVHEIIDEEKVAEELDIDMSITSDESTEPYPVNVVDREVFEAQTNVAINHQTGEANVVEQVENSYADVNLTQLVDGVDMNSAESIDTIKNFGLADLDDTDAAAVASIIARIQRGEDVPVYKEMPEKLKVMVRQISPIKSPDAFRITARELLNELIKELNMDKEYIDLNTALANELKVPDVLSIYADHNREKMEVDLLATADKLQETSPERAETLRLISKAFTDSYTFVRQKEMLNAPGIRKALKKGTDVKRCEKLCEEMNYKYKDNNLIIRDVRLLPQILDRKLGDDISYEAILRFVTLFLETCKNYSPKNLPEHTFMYYTVNNILTLDHTDASASEFNTLLIKNIEELISLIEEKFNNK